MLLEHIFVVSGNIAESPHHTSETLQRAREEIRGERTRKETLVYWLGGH